MKFLSYWLDSPYTPRAALPGDVETDVVIVGGGITGISAAYHCTRKGMKVVLVEKDLLAHGPAGKNSGMVVEGLEADFMYAAEKLGMDTAKEMWMRTIEARALTRSLVREHGIECDLEEGGGIFVSTSDAENEHLRKEMQMRRDASIASELMKEGTQLKGTAFKDALYTPDDFILNPIKFLRALASIAEANGARIYENTPATAFDERTVTTPHGVIRAKRVVLAMERNTPSMSEERCFMWGHQGIVTEPLAEDAVAALDWNTGRALWTIGDDYVSLRKIGSRLFFSSIIQPDLPEPEWEAARNRALGRFMEYFPSLRNAGLIVSHHWTCVLVYPHTQRPYLGNPNGYYEVFGHGGNGLTSGILLGKVLADSLGGAEVPELYQLN